MSGQMMALSEKYGHNVRIWVCSPGTRTVSSERALLKWSHLFPRSTLLTICLHTFLPPFPRHSLHGADSELQGSLAHTRRGRTCPPCCHILSLNLLLLSVTHRTQQPGHCSDRKVFFFFKFSFFEFKKVEISWKGRNVQNHVDEWKIKHQSKV